MISLANLYRVDYAGEEWRTFTVQLYALLADEGWSAKRFDDTCKWLVKNIPFATLTAADFFKAPTAQLHPRSWYLKMNHENPGFPVDVYEVDGITLYKERDGITLPLPKPKGYTRKPPPVKPEDELPTEAPPEFKAMMEKLSSEERTKKPQRIRTLLNIQPE